LNLPSINPITKCTLCRIAATLGFPRRTTSCGSSERLAWFPTHFPGLDASDEYRNALGGDKESHLGADRFSKEVPSGWPEQDGGWGRSDHSIEFSSARGACGIRGVVQGALRRGSAGMVYLPVWKAAAK